MTPDEPRVPRVSEEEVEGLSDATNDILRELALDLRDTRRALAAAEEERVDGMAWLKKVGIKAEVPLATAIAYLHGLYVGASERAERAEASAGRLRGALERACREDMDGQCVGCGADSSETHGPHCFAGAALGDSDGAAAGVIEDQQRLLEGARELLRQARFLRDALKEAILIVSDGKHRWGQTWLDAGVIESLAARVIPEDAITPSAALADSDGAAGARVIEAAKGLRDVVAAIGWPTMHGVYAKEFRERAAAIVAAVDALAAPTEEGE